MQLRLGLQAKINLAVQGDPVSKELERTLLLKLHMFTLARRMCKLCTSAKCNLLVSSKEPDSIPRPPRQANVRASPATRLTTAPHFHAKPRKTIYLAGPELSETSERGWSVSLSLSLSSLSVVGLLFRVRRPGQCPGSGPRHARCRTHARRMPLGRRRRRRP